MYIRKKATIIFIPLMMKMSISEADKFIIYAKEKYNEFWDGDKYLGDYKEIIPAKGNPHLLDHMIWKKQGIC